MVQLEPPCFQSPFIQVAAVIAPNRRIHQARERPFGLVLIVRRQSNLALSVLQPGILPEGLLKGVQGGDGLIGRRSESLPPGEGD